MNHKTTEKKHMECLVCGQGFNSSYDEDLHFYPVYHPKLSDGDVNACEIQFYKTLMNMYRHLHETQLTLQIPELISRVDFSFILLKREMIVWSIDRGFLTYDNLQRIMVPPAIDEITKELFESENLSSDESVKTAIDYIKSAYRVLKEELASWRPKIEGEEEEVEAEAATKKLNRMFTADMTVEKNGSTKARRDRQAGMYSR